ncbi:MAG: hypothetical protein AAF541_07655 [Pseudomonadota bacterium]
MKPPYQVPLAIDRPLEQRLDNFVVGGNAELLGILSKPASDFLGLWITGPEKSGRTHLLRGCAQALQDRGHKAVFVDCAHNPARALESLAYAVEWSLAVCIDDIERLVDQREAEGLLLAAYQSALANRSLFVASHTVSAHSLNFSLADLNSRMRSLMHFSVVPLNDVEKAQLLRNRAKRRGYHINQAVLDYWLARAPRDTGTLLTDLDVLDRATLARKQVVTIPLLKQVLGY